MVEVDAGVKHADGDARAGGHVEGAGGGVDDAMSPLAHRQRFCCGCRGNVAVHLLADVGELAAGEPISGAEAYRRDAEATLPHLEAAGSSVTFLGEGAEPLIRPMDERWDLVVLLRYLDVNTFLGMTSNCDYLPRSAIAPQRSRTRVCSPWCCRPSDAGRSRQGLLRKRHMHEAADLRLADHGRSAGVVATTRLNAAVV